MGKDDFLFVHVPNPGREVVCPHCGKTAPLPATDPWLLIEGEAMEPELVSFPCPHCGELIELDNAD